MHGIQRDHVSYDHLVADPEVNIVDVAAPQDRQRALGNVLMMHAIDIVRAEANELSSG